PAHLGPGRCPATRGAPLRRGTTPLGSRTHLRLAGSLPPPVQGLRVPDQHLGERHLRRHDTAPHPPPRPSSTLTLFRRPLGQSRGAVGQLIVLKFPQRAPQHCPPRLLRQIAQRIRSPPLH